MSFYESCFISSLHYIKCFNIQFFNNIRTHNFACGLLILLKLPLHLFVLILKGENTGSILKGKNTGASLLTLTICGLTLHS